MVMKPHSVSRCSQVERCCRQGSAAISVLSKRLHFFHCQARHRARNLLDRASPYVHGQIHSGGLFIAGRNKLSQARLKEPNFLDGVVGVPNVVFAAPG